LIFILKGNIDVTLPKENNLLRSAKVLGNTMNTVSFTIVPWKLLHGGASRTGDKQLGSVIILGRFDGFKVA